jgi:hypothetical protein
VAEQTRPAQPEQPLEAPETAPKKPNRAQAILAAKRERDAREQLERQAKDEAENLYYLPCPREAGHMAAFLTKFPASGPITAEMWETWYHKAGEKWDMPKIPCQECWLAEQGREWEAPVRPVKNRDGGFDFYIIGTRAQVVRSIPREVLNVRKSAITKATRTEPNRQ